MEYLDYYADTMVWTAVLTFVLTFAAGLLAWVLWMRRSGGARLAQVSCPQGGGALVQYREPEAGCIDVTRCALRADGRRCQTECAGSLARAAARLRG